MQSNPAPEIDIEIPEIPEIDIPEIDIPEIDIEIPEVPERVLQWVPAPLRVQLRDSLCAGDWSDALCYATSEDRISLCMDLFIAGLIPDEDQPALLAEAIIGGDLPCRERDMILACFMKFRLRGRRIFDGDAARAAFDALPDQVTIYRGTTAAEGSQYPYGLCWTLDRNAALFFAIKHRRFRNLDSPPVVLTATVRRDDISGLLFERGEQEVLILPRAGSIVSEAVPEDTDVVPPWADAA